MLDSAMHKDDEHPTGLPQRITSWCQNLGGNSGGRGRLFLIRRRCSSPFAPLPRYPHLQDVSWEPLAIQTSRQGSKKASPATAS